MNPYKRGEWTLKTTGSLAPTGPLFGLKTYFFLGDHLGIPSLLSAEMWSSFVREGDGLFPFGFQIAMKRVPLPLKAGPLSFGLSANLTVSEQDAKDNEIPLVLFAGGLGLHAQMPRGEIFVEGKAKQTGHLTGELIDPGWSFLAGFKWVYGVSNF